MGTEEEAEKIIALIGLVQRKSFQARLLVEM
jgi:hypothetical protein